MKNWERIAGFITTVMAVLSMYGTYALQPYRLELAEKAIASNAQIFKAEVALVRAEAAADREKSTDAKEILIRMEERLKNLQGTVDTLARNQRIGFNGSRQEYGKTE